jgi:hypothetical protein
MRAFFQVTESSNHISLTMQLKKLKYGTLSAKAAKLGFIRL